MFWEVSPFSQPSPLTSYTTIVEYHNQDINSPQNQDTQLYHHHNGPSQYPTPIPYLPHP